jgi:hypothetical protein
MKAPVFFIRILLLIFFSNSFQFLSAQVGIGTSNPRMALEIAGDMIVSQTMDVMNYDDLTDSGTSTFLLQEWNNSIKSIDVSNPSGAALGYIQEYIIVNPNLDWVKDFDTGIDATDFVLVVISAVYNSDLQLSSGPGRAENSSIPYTASFVSGGTWHMIADYPMAANSNNSDVGTWIITTLIFSNDLNKQFGIINIPMADGTTGSAILPIID